jgi:hypothetical protein
MKYLRRYHKRMRNNREHFTTCALIWAGSTSNVRQQVFPIHVSETRLDAWGHSFPPEAPTDLTMKITVAWIVTSCGLIDVYRRVEQSAGFIFGAVVWIRFHRTKKRLITDVGHVHGYFSVLHMCQTKSSFTVTGAAFPTKVS